MTEIGCFVLLVGWFLNVLVNYWAISKERLTILRAATHETELGDHDFCLSRSYYSDTDPTSRERTATAEIEPGTSSPGDRMTNRQKDRDRARIRDSYYTSINGGRKVKKRKQKNIG